MARLLLHLMHRLAVILALVYLGLGAFLFVFQRSYIYIPQPRSSVAGVSTITMPADGAQVLVAARQRIGPDAVLYFGGNSEDVSYSVPDLSAAFPNYAIYAPHYRGYGGSSGKPSEAALVADALALFDKLHSQHEHIVVIGRSLGSGIAIHLASVRPVARLILVTPYNSLQEVAADQFPYFPVRWMLLDKFESWRYAPQVTAPTLVIAAEYDELIPRASTDALYKGFRAGVARFRVVPGAGHNTISESAGYAPLLMGV